MKTPVMDKPEVERVVAEILGRPVELEEAGTGRDPAYGNEAIVYEADGVKVWHLPRPWGDEDVLVIRGTGEPPVEVNRDEPMLAQDTDSLPSWWASKEVEGRAASIWVRPDGVWSVIW